MDFQKRKGWMIPLLLVVLCLIPSVAGIVRLAELASGTARNADSARFFAMPVPVVLHIMSATVFCLLGAFQFSAAWRNRAPRWHRNAGKILFISGILAAFTGLWMTQVYPLAHLQNSLLYIVRWVVGIAMVICLLLSFWYIRQRNVPAHRAWIIRAYAIGQGAGTQALVNILWWICIGMPDLNTYCLLMTASWIINLLVGEWAIRKGR